MFESVFTDELGIGFVDALDVLAEWNVRHVDLRGNIFGLPIGRLPDDVLARVRGLLDERDIRVGALESSLAKVHLPDAERRAQEAEKLEGLIRAADAFDCRLVRSFFYWQPEADQRGALAVQPDQMQLVLDAFMPLADRAREAGLVLAFENCGVTTNEVFAVLDAIGEPRWGIAWDCSNSWFSEDEAREAPSDHIHRVAARARIVHVKARGAAESLGPVLPYAEILIALANHGLKGPVSIETHNPDQGVTNEARTREALETVRVAWPTFAPGAPVAKEPDYASCVREYEPVNFVVVGLGMGHERARVITKTPGNRLVGVCDLDEGRLAKAHKEFGVEGSKNLDDWLGRDDVDAVYVLTPSGLHGELAVPALEAGKHVIVTKPMDVSLEACDRMIRAAEAHDALLAVDFDKRFEKELLSLRKFVRGEKFGEFLGGEISLKVQRTDEYYASGGGWRGTLRMDGGGVFSNQCIHHIDQVVFALGVPEAVRASLWTQTHEIEGEDLGCALWRYANGAVVSLHATTSYPHTTWYHSIELHGHRGAASLSAGGPLKRARNRFFVDDVWTDELPESVPPEWISAADNMAAAIRTGAPLACDGRDGRRTQAVLAAIYESGRGNGGWVPVRAETA